jgi:hypothetical protein
MSNDLIRDDLGDKMRAVLGFYQWGLITKHQAIKATNKTLIEFGIFEATETPPAILLDGQDSIFERHPSLCAQ